MNLMLLGAQGSGKGTQGALLAQQLGLVPCASGDMLREAIAQGTPIGQQARPYVERGDLVPDELMIGMIRERLNDLAGAKGIILDGFPRNLVQAERLDARLAEMGQTISRVIYLEVPREILLERLSGRYICRAHGHVYNIKTNPPKVPGICDIDGSELYQRSDDTGEKIQRRLDIFFAETLPLTEYYARQGKLVTVDGTQSIEDVNRAILAKLGVAGQ
ncbi:MAG TPA: adenylate kinase [Ktedonobacterales bacterium]